MGVFACLSGPICRTLRTSPAASTMKCIACGASMRTTRSLTPTVSQNIILPPTRCRCHPPNRVSFIHYETLTFIDSLPTTPALHSIQSPSHRWDRNLKTPARGTLFSMTFGGRTDCSCQFIASLTNTILSLSLTKRVKRSFFVMCCSLILPASRSYRCAFTLWCQTLRHLPNRTD